MSEVKAERGSNLTPKSEMHIGRDWAESSWNQAFKAACKKWDKDAYLKKQSAPKRVGKRSPTLEDAPRVEKIQKKQTVIEYK